MRLIDADALWEIFREKQNSLTARRGGYRFLDGEDRAKYDRLEITLDYIKNASEVDVVPVVRGEWVDDENGTEWDSHQCSVCKKSSLSEMIYEDDYDEGLDGEWFYLGKRENGIIEHLTNYCPNCGAKMESEGSTWS